MIARLWLLRERCDLVRMGVTRPVARSGMMVAAPGTRLRACDDAFFRHDGVQLIGFGKPVTMGHEEAIAMEVLGIVSKASHSKVAHPSGLFANRGFFGCSVLIWAGTTCYIVLQLQFNLSNNSIVGGLPACIASVEALTHLNLSGNHLKYRIYPRLVFSEKLLVLDLSYNDLSGPIPSKISETTEKLGLVLLDLSHNQLSGEIPVKITELKSLQALILPHNLDH
ncbi:Leucine-rich repeat [Sesbania bispinosa]|nr:Leucine-rich repeat [Sesbania bispinosa]